MKTLLSLALVAVLSGLAGCSATPSAADFQRAEELGLYGPSPSDPEGLLRARLRSTMFDPDSLKQFSVGDAYKGWLRQGAFGDIWWGWYIPYQFNGKNRYGGYVGVTSDRAFVQQDRLVIGAVDGTQERQRQRVYRGMGLDPDDPLTRWMAGDD